MKPWDQTPEVTDGRIDNAAGFKAVLDAAFAKAGVTVTTAADNAAGTVSVSSTTSIAYASVAASGKGGVLDINIEGKTRAQIESMITTVDNAAKAVTSAAATLGAVAARFEMQKTFVTTLMDTIEKGVSGLVDADMTEESTKLQALQVKQQLGVQALSIANQSSQNILSLFRG